MKDFGNKFTRIFNLLMQNKFAPLLIIIFLMASCEKEVIPEPDIKTLTVSTFAGSGVPGDIDGAGVDAQLNGHTHISIGPDDVLYLPVTFYNILGDNPDKLRTISPAGTVSTPAMPELSLWTDPKWYFFSFYPKSITFNDQGDLVTSIEASGRVDDVRGERPVIIKNFFNSPEVIYKYEGTWISSGFDLTAMDGDNQLFGTFYPFKVIYKIQSNSYAKLFGSDDEDIKYADGVGESARFGKISDIAVDKNNNLIIADASNHCIRKITPQGVVSTIAGTNIAGYQDGKGTNARFNFPNGLDIDENGNIYVADTFNNRIRKITPDGMVTTIAGDGEMGYKDGPPDVAQFKIPTDVAVNSKGHIFIMDAGDFRVRVLK